MAGFQDDLDSEDDLASPTQVTVATEDVELSSEEEQSSPAIPEQPTITADQDYEQESEKIKVPKANKKDSLKGSRTPSPKLARNEKKAEITLTANNHATRTVVNDTPETKARSDTVDTVDNESDDDSDNVGVTVLQDVEDVSEEDGEGTGQVVVQEEEADAEEDMEEKVEYF